MFVGHLALALVAKRGEPEVQLGWFVAAAMTLDLVWPVFLLLGIACCPIIRRRGSSGLPVIEVEKPAEA